MGYGGHKLRLKCTQVHHHSPAGTFTRVPGPGTPVIPCIDKLRISIAAPPLKFYVCRDVSHTHTPTRARRHTHTHTRTHTPHNFHLSAQVYLLHAINPKDHKIIMAVSIYKLECGKNILKMRLENVKNAIQKCEEMWKCGRCWKTGIYIFQYFS